MGAFVPCAQSDAELLLIQVGNVDCCGLGQQLRDASHKRVKEVQLALSSGVGAPVGVGGGGNAKRGTLG